MTSTSSLALLLTAALWLAVPAVAPAHEGEVHDDAPTAKAALPAGDGAPRASAATELFEVVAVLRTDALVLYVDRYDDNTPVSQAAVEVDGGDGAAIRGRMTETAPGEYSLPLETPVASAQALTVSVETADAADLLAVSLDAPAAEAAVAKTATLDRRVLVFALLATLVLLAGIAAWRWRVASLAVLPLLLVVALPTDVHAGQQDDAPRRLADGSVFVPKPAQHAWGIRTQVAAIRTHAATVTLSGIVIPDPDSAGLVQATQAGSVLPGPKGMPVPGRAVRKGEVLAYLRFAADAVERGNQQALLADLDAQLSLARQRVRRYEQLAGGVGAVSQEALDTARTEVAALEKRRARVDDSVNRSDALIAPASGVIGESHVVAGQVVDAKETLFEIVDPSRLWIEALAYDPAQAAAVHGGSARAGNGPGAVALELAFVGGGRQLRAQALPLLFRITTKNAPVAIGQPVEVVAVTRDTVRGVKVARGALAGSGDDALLWVHVEAERFVPRRVTVRPLDAASVVVTGGLADGDRVVEQGAALLGQVR